MDTDLRAIRQTLGEACAGDADYTIYDLMPDNPELPCVVIPWPDEVEYVTTMGGRAEMVFTLMVAVPDMDFKRAQIRMDDVLSVPGLPTQIMDYEPDTPVWTAIRVTRATNIRREQAQNSQTYLIADIELTIKT